MVPGRASGHQKFAICNHIDPSLGSISPTNLGASGGRRKRRRYLMIEDEPASMAECSSDKLEPGGPSMI